MADERRSNPGSTAITSLSVVLCSRSTTKNRHAPRGKTRLFAPPSYLLTARHKQPYSCREMESHGPIP